MANKQRAQTDRLVSVAEAAEILDRDSSLVRRFCRQGRLPALRIGGLGWVIRLADVRAFGRAKRPGGRPPAEVRPLP